MDRYNPLIENLGNKFIEDPDEREDFVQDVFIQAYQSLSQFRGEAQFSTWLYQIGRNLLKKRSKLHKPVVRIDDHHLFDFLTLSPLQKWKEVKKQATHDSALLREELKSKVQNLVASLPPKYKIPIVLFYFENLSYKEISVKLNLKINTLKSTIFRGKEILKDLFHEK